MQTVDLTTKDCDINVYFGDLKYMDTPRKESYGYVKYLYNDLTDIRKYYIRLGFHLDEFARHMFFTDFGFASLEDFCLVNLGLDKSAVSRCIGVYREFNASNVFAFAGKGCQTKGCAMELAEEWKDYSYTQLCEMLPLSSEDRKKVTPDMSCKQIREFKKQLKQKKKAVASTQPETPEVNLLQSKRKKLFDKKKYDSTIGIVRQNVVRHCDAIDGNVVFNVFDKNGKFLGGNIMCDLIYKSGHEYYFRLWQSKEKSIDQQPDLKQI